MSLSPNKKTLILFVILFIAGGAAFLYFDPLDLQLLGPEPVPQKVAMSQAKPPVAAPKAVPTPKPAVAQNPEAKPAVMPTNMPKPAKSVATQPATPARISPPVLQAKAKEPVKQPITKPAKPKPVRPKNLDFRHCLTLDTDAAIAKCAGE